MKNSPIDSDSVNSDLSVPSPQESSLSINENRLPVTIITGFLGSGKTTLLNYILETFEGFKVAVLVNEFGDINIDSQFIVQLDQDMIELTNGCICCSINDDLRDAVHRVLGRRDRVDYLVVETTGVADPLPVTLTFLGTELRDMTRLDSILTLVDAETFAPDVFDSQAAYSQIAYGDIIVLNKTDLVSDKRLEEVEEGIRSIKTGARILRAEKGRVPLPLIIDVKVGETGAYQEKAAEAIAAGVDDHPHHDHSEHGHSEHGHSEHGHSEHGHSEHGHSEHKHSDHQHPEHDHSGHDHSGHDHSGHNHHDHSEHDHSGHDHHDHSGHLENDGFMSVSFQYDRPFGLRQFQQFLDNHLPENIFRAKGVLWFQESPARHFFQLTGKRFQLEDSEWSGPQGNQLVFIGQNLDKGTIEQLLEDCLAPVSLPVGSLPR